jgi:hypothetical protein
LKVWIGKNFGNETGDSWRHAFTWITRFFLKRALVCSRWLVPIALGVGEAEETPPSGQETGG